MASNNGGGAEPSWAWLGLLKWSLSYTDGTKPSEESLAPMSKEDREFLEEVMKDGIIDEGKRMNTILIELTGALQAMKDNSELTTTTTTDNNNNNNNGGGGGSSDSKEKETNEDGVDVAELLLELRDIVEHIDYAKGFSAMGGLTFLLGCASEREIVSPAIRSNCLAVLGTLCQNNPSVQYSMLEHGAIRVLIDLYFAELSFQHEKEEEPSNNNDDNNNNNNNNNNNMTQLTSRIVQTLSCTVRSHATAEQIFCDNEAGRIVIESGLGLLRTKNNESSSSSSSIQSSQKPAPPPSLQLCQRSLFFLQALVTSDRADKNRIDLFKPCITYIVEHYLPDSEKEDTHFEIREMTLSLLHRILTQNKCIEAVLDHKHFLIEMGVHRISTIRSLSGEDREFAEEELNYWETLMIELAKVKKIPE